MNSLVVDAPAEESSRVSAARVRVAPDGAHDLAGDEAAAAEDVGARLVTDGRHGALCVSRDLNASPLSNHLNASPMG